MYSYFVCSKNNLLLRCIAIININSTFDLFSQNRYFLSGFGNFTPNEFQFVIHSKMFVACTGYIGRLHESSTTNLGKYIFHEMCVNLITYKDDYFQHEILMTILFNCCEISS